MENLLNYDELLIFTESDTVTTAPSLSIEVMMVRVRRGEGGGRDT